jgi:hypothetical protein
VLRNNGCVVGHKNSRPVRIGNGASNHVQLVSTDLSSLLGILPPADYPFRTHVSFRIYTANCDNIVPPLIRILIDRRQRRMDCVYLSQKEGKPLGYDMW